MRHNVRKRTFGHVHPAKIKISLCICTVWSESLQCTFKIATDAKILHAMDAKFLHANNKSDQTEAVQTDLSPHWAHVRRCVFSLYGTNNCLTIKKLAVLKYLKTGFTVRSIWIWPMQEKCLCVTGEHQRPRLVCASIQYEHIYSTVSINFC